MDSKYLKIMMVIIGILIVVLILIITILNIYSKSNGEEENINFSNMINNTNNTEQQKKKYKTNEILRLNIDDRTMCLNYFQDLKTNLLYNTKEAYNYMTEEYRQKRFGTEEGLLQYVNSNITELAQIKLEKYQVNNNDDYTEYVCMDQYENLYIFKETSVMQYTVTLDTYTLEEEEFNSTYNNSDEAMKVKMNSDKIIQMMNRRDYKTIYNLLNGTFKNNYFKTEEEFEKYMKEKYPLHYKAEFANTENEGNTYIQEINLTDITEQDEEIKQMTIIMQLKEGTNFEMSFEI